MYKIVPTKHYLNSYKKLKQSGQLSDKTNTKLEFAINLLAKGEVLPKEYRDHGLVGELKGYRECHIKGDLLLIYQIRKEILIVVLVDIGSHSKIFG